MAYLLVDEHLGHIEAIPRYSGAAAGDLVGMDNAKVDAVADPVKGIVINAIPTDVPPVMLKLAGKGCIIQDTALDLTTPNPDIIVGTLIWSDGDGTYSSVQPTSGAADTQRCLMGVVRRVNTTSTGVGADIELMFSMNTDAVT